MSTNLMVQFWVLFSQDFVRNPFRGKKTIITQSPENVKQNTPENSVKDLC